MRSDAFTRALCWIATEDDAMRAFVTSTEWHTDGAYHELMSDTGETLKQSRLHADLSGVDG